MRRIARGPGSRIAYLSERHTDEGSRALLANLKADGSVILSLMGSYFNSITLSLSEEECKDLFLLLKEVEEEKSA
jgi:hypothetical protein